MMADLDENQLVDLAKYAEQAERYDDMAESMKKLVVDKGKDVLSDEERNLLSVAYKNIVGSRRTASRVIDNSLENAKLKGNENEVKICEEYKATIVGELNKICDEVINLLDTYLIRAVSEMEIPANDKEAKNNLISSQIFYQKMKGDYIRYKVEVEPDAEKRKALSKQSEDAYIKATDIANVHLQPTHPIRLGLALNFSVFYYEIKMEHQAAIELANKAFDSAIQELDDNSENNSSYKDSTLILQLLRDNLSLWKSSEEGCGDQDQDD